MTTRLLPAPRISRRIPTTVDAESAAAPSWDWTTISSTASPKKPTTSSEADDAGPPPRFRSPKSSYQRRGGRAVGAIGGVPPALGGIIARSAIDADTPIVRSHRRRRWRQRACHHGGCVSGRAPDSSSSWMLSSDGPRHFRRRRRRPFVDAVPFIQYRCSRTMRRYYYRFTFNFFRCSSTLSELRIRPIFAR